MDYLKLEKEYPLHVYETGPDGKLNLYSLFDFFQDIASDHAVSLGYGRNDLLRNNNFWVLSRIYAEISQFPRWGESIIIKTWPRGTDRLFALRDFEVRFPDGRPVALATSSWLIVDQTTHRIQRPDDTLIRYRSETLGGNALPRNAAKLEPASAEGRKTQTFSVRTSDLDINMHTNNVRYLKWVTDSYDLDFIMNNVPLSAEINYLAESHFDDDIFIRVSSDNENGHVFSHSVTRVHDNAELCRIRIHWINDHN
jgi:acyl-ACP thioesterase